MVLLWWQQQVHSNTSTCMHPHDAQEVDKDAASPAIAAAEIIAPPIADPDSHFALAPQPTLGSPNSPTQPANVTATMDITGTSDAPPTNVTNNTTWQLQQYAQGMGGALPLEDTNMTVGMEVTAGVPDLHALLNEDDTSGMAAAAPSPPAQPAAGQQVSKWGFLPGAEPTTNIDLTLLGVLVCMGAFCMLRVCNPPSSPSQATSVWVRKHMHMYMALQQKAPHPSTQARHPTNQQQPPHQQQCLKHNPPPQYMGCPLSPRHHLQAPQQDRHDATACSSNRPCRPNNPCRPNSPPHNVVRQPQPPIVHHNQHCLQCKMPSMQCDV